MTDRKANGEPIAGLSADAWNSFLEAADDYKQNRQRSVGQRLGDVEYSGDRIKVRNSSGGHLALGQVVKVPKDSYLLDPVRRESLWLDGVAIAAGSDCVAIYQQTCASTDIMEGQVSGVCVAMVDVNSLADERATPAAGNSNLVSGSSGPVKILHAPGTGSQLCVVLFDGAGDAVDVGIGVQFAGGLVDIPAYGCAVIIPAIYPDTDHLAQPYAKYGYSLIGGRPHYALDAIASKDTVGPDWPEYGNLVLNGETIVTTGTPGTGFTAREQPAYGRLFDGFNPNGGDFDASWYEQPWGPVYYASDARSFQLWPGVAGFRMYGFPDEYEVSPGVYAWRAKFIKDDVTPMRLRIATTTAGGDVLDGEIIRTWSAPADTFDGSDATHPPLAFNVTVEECFGGYKAFNAVAGDVVSVSIDPNAYRPPFGTGSRGLVPTARVNDTTTHPPLVDERIGFIAMETDIVAGGRGRGWGIMDGFQGGSGVNMQFQGVEGMVVSNPGTSVRSLAAGTDLELWRNRVVFYERLPNA